MYRKRRSAKLLAATFLAGIAYLLMTLFASLANAHADTVFMVGGADVISEEGTQNGFYMPAINNGDFCRGDNQCKTVPFSGGAGVLTPNNPEPLDQSVANAVGPLVKEVKNTPGPKQIVAISAGTPVALEAASQLQDDPAGPPASELSVVVEGGIDRGIGKLVPEGTRLNSIGYTPNDYEPTKYPTTIVTHEFDGMGTPTPDPFSHPLAATNTIVGSEYAHVEYFTTSLNDPNNHVTQDGNTTTIVLPNRGELPLVQAMSDVGMPQPDSFRDQVQADIDAARQAPPAQQPPIVPPQMVDQMITTAAPMFAQGINEQKDDLVNALVPILANDPQLQQYIPPALMEDVPTGSDALADVAAPSAEAQQNFGDAAGGQVVAMDNVQPQNNSTADSAADFSDLVPNFT